MSNKLQKISWANVGSTDTLVRNVRILDATGEAPYSGYFLVFDKVGGDK